MKVLTELVVAGSAEGRAARAPLAPGICRDPQCPLVLFQSLPPSPPSSLSDVSVFFIPFIRMSDME